MSALFAHLATYGPDDWSRAVETLAAEGHPVDRNATRIWFAFFPLELHELVASAPDRDAAARKLGLMGSWRLADQIDTSHRFFYAHRYWPQVKGAIEAAAAPFPQDLTALARNVADVAARRSRLDREFLLGFALAGLMTLRQAGPEAFAAAPGKVALSDKARAMSALQVLKRRARDDWQGLLGFTRGLKKRWTVTFDENDPDAKFTVLEGQELASGAQSDPRDYRSRDLRCTPGEGPIPVECRAASCGTCWVGVLGGAEKLSPVVDRDERRRMRVFGYPSTDEERPLIRLACQARASGAVSIVIPPWNGMLGAYLSRRS
ncbi:MAG: (2Fe-2S)-binding protein [Acidobacteria bacterium]|nr:(2Fe-2S)-binding protein [Acidobacteriota bacterium]